MKLSIIVPCFNEQEVIRETHKRLAQVDYMGMEPEIIYVNDGSRDDTLSILKEIAGEDNRAKVVSFQKNFGHQPAVSAGIKYASGDALVIIDADLQDPPDLIPKMIEKWREGYDIVYGKRAKRKGESVFKLITAWGYYRVLGFLGGDFIPKDTGDFRLIDRKVADFLNSLSERNRFLRGLTAWAGFRSIPVEYVRDERFAGETKYTLKKMLRLAEDGITSFSDKPLKLSFGIGALAGILGFLYMIASIVIWAMGNPLGSLHFVLSLLSMLMALLFICIGVVGLYLSRMYDEAKGRPYYIVGETVNFED